MLVLPSTVNASYTWGSPGDDLLEGLLDRPHVMRSQLSQSQGTERSADLVSALGDYLEAARYEPGVLAPIARRLGDPVRPHPQRPRVAGNRATQPSVVRSAA